MSDEKTLLHYKILEQLGEGGMGTVYRATDTRMGRTVALKVLRRDLASDQEWSRRFEREVRVASSFSHPGIATLYDYQQDGDNSFYTMEYVEGLNLREVLKKQGSLPIAPLIACALQVADALAEAHRKGIVHRDLKPENVMESTSGYYKILDFGLARYSAAGLTAPGSGSALETLPQETTQAGKVVGTVSYMSPEQAQGIPVDARSDVFAFGSLFYELATGISPFKRNNAIATFHAIVHEPVKPLREARPEAPQELEWILARCLSKDPRQRYQAADELAEDLRALPSGGDSSGRGVSAIRGYPGANVARSWQIWGASSRRWAMATWGTIVVILALIAGRLWLFPPGPGAPPLPVAGQQGGPPGSAGAPGSLLPAASSSSQRSIAVSPFVNNTGDPESAWLTQGIPEMITTALAGSGDLSVISTQRLNDLMSMAGRDGKSGMDGATATELARWAGASMVVSGSVYRTDGLYRIDAQAYDTATGQVVAASRAQGDEVFSLVDTVTEDLKRGLIESGRAPEMASGPEAPSEPKGRDAGVQVATGHILPAGVSAHPATEKAYRHYMDGMSSYKDLRFAESEESFRQALDLDPSFAQAQMRLGMTMVLQGDREPGFEWIDRAAETPEGLPDKERRIVKVLHSYYTENDGEAAEEQVKEFSVAFPDDQEAMLWLAKGRVDVEGDRAGAVRVLSRIVREQPDNLPAVALLGQHMAVLGSSEEAIGILNDYKKRYPRAAGSLQRIIREVKSEVEASTAASPESEESSAD